MGITGSSCKHYQGFIVLNNTTIINTENIVLCVRYGVVLSVSGW